ncbi:MAG TPA: DUF4153 domain-containing protein, partial [Gemmatimonadaceae bacterium]|nr:DUF4153 domain-containing protein [Gemmatimonadaceae bacterium]
MRLPSLDTLAVRARQVLVRFPVTLTVGVAAAVFAIIATTHDAADVWARLTFVAALGLPLTFAIAVLGEARAWSSLVRWGLYVACAIALAGFFAVWSGIDQKPDAIRYFQLAAALHLAVAFLPFVGVPETRAFWQYNRRLFLSFLRAVVFSGVLFVGLAIALASIDKLFGLHVPGETYGRLWFVLAFVANTWIFLAGVPEKLTALESDRDYPRALKVFTQYILTPLVAVYLLILLAYLVKILITGQWPSGWIGYLVTSVAVAGILGFLLVHPLRDEPGEGWIRTFRRLLFIGLIPAALMLLGAFAKRIAPYGLTELRYLGTLLGVWLLAIAVLFTLRREHGIRIIPLSLCVLLLVTLFGPLGATHRAIASQGSRLERELAMAKATPSPNRVTPAEVQASGALEFLVEHRASAEIAKAFGASAPSNAVLAQVKPYQADSISRSIMAAASLDYSSRWRRPVVVERPGFFTVRTSARESLAVSGFDWLVPVGTRDSVATIGSDTLRFAFDSTASRLTVAFDRGPRLSFDFEPLLRSFEVSDSLAGSNDKVPSS